MLRMDLLQCFTSLLTLMISFSAITTSKGTPNIIDSCAQSINRGVQNAFAFANFKAHRFSYLNIKSLSTDYVLNEEECGFGCVDTPSCFSYNLAASDGINGVLCELLPSDKYNKSDNFTSSQLFHHFSIASPCISGPCQNGGSCVPIYEENSYVCLCSKAYTGSICQTASPNCTDIYISGERKSGVYMINPDGSGIIGVFCDQTTGGGGWLVFQKRLEGSVDFYRNWTEYKRGFGSLTGEFWLGLDKIHRLTTSGSYKLRVDLEDFAGKTYYAEYDLFKVANEGEKYQLSLGSYSGTAGDGLSHHNGRKFSTKDQDNDASKLNCAAQMAIQGAWWYGDCRHSNLNGVYRNKADDGTLKWDNIYSIKRAEMKIRPMDF